MKLSDDLLKLRCERPDEWQMDRFIAKAKRLEEIHIQWASYLIKEMTEKDEHGFCSFDYLKNDPAFADTLAEIRKYLTKE